MYFSILVGNFSKTRVPNFEVSSAKAYANLQLFLIVRIRKVL
jgi:hypothetical protein